MKRGVIAWLPLATIAGLLHCGDSVITGNGGSSETVNAKVAITDTLVSVIVTDAGNGPLRMHIFSSNYRPFNKSGFNDSVTGGMADTLHWYAPVAGTYNLLLRSEAAGAACFIHGVSLDQGAVDTLDCTLGGCGRLSGILAVSDSSIINERYSLSIFGSPFYGMSDSLGRFLIEAVPPGEYTLSVRSTAKRLFVAASDYMVTAEAFDPSTRLRIMIR